MKPAIFFVSLFLALFAAQGVYAQGEALPRYNTTEAKLHEGEYAIVYGRVDQVYFSPKSGHIFINLDGKYPYNKYVGFIPREHTYKFKDLKSLEGETVELTGTITTYKGKFETIIKNPEQIRVVKLNNPY